MGADIVLKQKDSKVIRESFNLRDEPERALSTREGVYDMNDDNSVPSFADLRLDSQTYQKVGDEPFKVPPEVLHNPNLIFGYHVAVLYETDRQCREELVEALGVTKQTIWLWRRSRPSNP